MSNNQKKKSFFSPHSIFNNKKSFIRSYTINSNSNAESQNNRSSLQKPTDIQFEHDLLKNKDMEIVEEFDDAESLRQFIVELSNEFDQEKENYLKILNEKDDVIKSLLESENLKDQELLNLNSKIEKLNDTIQQYEIDLYAKHLDKKKRMRMSVYYGKFEENGNNEDEDEDVKILREEILSKEVDIQNLKAKNNVKLKNLEEKYQNYINELQNELQRFQESFTHKSENDSTMYNIKLNEINETTQLLENRNIQLINEIQNLENLRKNEFFKYNKDLEICNEQITSLKCVLDEKNVILNRYDDICKKNNNLISEVNSLKLKLAEKYNFIEKLNNENNLLKSQISSADNSKKSLIIIKNTPSEEKTESSATYKLEKLKEIHLIAENIELKNTIENLHNEILYLKMKKFDLNEETDNPAAKIFDGNGRYLTLQDCLDVEEEINEEVDLKMEASIPVKNLLKIESSSNSILIDNINEKTIREGELINLCENYKFNEERLLIENMNLNGLLAHANYEIEKIKTDYRIKENKLKEYIKKVMKVKT